MDTLFWPAVEFLKKQNKKQLRKGGEMCGLFVVLQLSYIKTK